MKRYIPLLYLFIGVLPLNGQNDNLKLTMLNIKQLDTLPSASGIEIIEGSIYVVGDDSPYLFKLDVDFNIKDKFLLTGNKRTENNRVPKSIKSDFESIASYTNKNGNTFLSVLSSGSKLETRDTIHVFSLSEKKLVASKNIRPLFDEIREKANFSSSDEINIEAFAIGREKVFLMQRGNNYTNILVVVDRENFLNYIFSTDSHLPDIDVRSFRLPSLKNTTAGFSGACLMPDESGLIFVASLEATSNAYDDGEILGSYIGFLKLNDHENNIETIILRKDDKPLKTKLEGVAVKSYKNNTYQIVAVSDNDDGSSMIFDLELELEP
jgi:hypothetical protein